MIEVAPIKLIQSQNGKKVKSIQEKFITAIISIATTGIISCAGFLWKVNSTLSRIEEHQMEMDKSFDNIQSDMNDVHIKLIDTKERLIRIETLQKR